MQRKDSRYPEVTQLREPVRRSAYYFASYRFVKFLIEAKGMETFLRLYASEQPEADLKILYGMERKDAVNGALPGDC